MPFNIQGPELILILIIALIVIGPGKLPDVGAALGKSLREFRSASNDAKEAVNPSRPANATQAAAVDASPASAPTQAQASGSPAQVPTAPAAPPPPPPPPAAPAPPAAPPSEPSSDPTS